MTSISMAAAFVNKYFETKTSGTTSTSRTPGLSGTSVKRGDELADASSLGTGFATQLNSDTSTPRERIADTVLKPENRLVFAAISGSDISDN